MKRKLKFLGISLGLVLLGAAFIGLGLFLGNREMERFKELPVIESEEELTAALEGDSKIYCLINMPVYGEAVSDPMDIIEGDYAYFMYTGELCELQKDSSYKWTRDRDNVLYEVSPALRLYDTYEVLLPEKLEHYTYYVLEKTVLNEENVKEEFLENVKDNYYYPTGVVELSGKKRYETVLAETVENSALYAYVGDGKITLALNDDGQSYIIPNGNINDLFDCFGKIKGMLITFAGMMIVLPLGVTCTFGTVILMIAGLFNIKKNPKKFTK